MALKASRAICHYLLESQMLEMRGVTGDHLPPPQWTRKQNPQKVARPRTNSRRAADPGWNSARELPVKLFFYNPIQPSTEEMLYYEISKFNQVECVF